MPPVRGDRNHASHRWGARGPHVQTTRAMAPAHYRSRFRYFRCRPHQRRRLASLPPGLRLVLELDGPVVERSSSSTFSLISASETPLNVVRRALNTAQDDPRIVGLAIRVIDPTFELAQAEELTAAIDTFRRHGKWVSAYMETAGEGGFGNLPYYVASSADELFDDAARRA